MIYLVYSIYDSKAEAYLPPFILPKKAMAVRAFTDCVNSPTHQFGQNPEDYTLFELGSFDDQHGQYLLHRSVISCGNGLEFRKPDHPKSPELGNGRQAPQADKSESSLANVASIQSDPPSENPS